MHSLRLTVAEGPSAEGPNAEGAPSNQPLASCLCYRLLSPIHGTSKDVSMLFPSLRNPGNSSCLRLTLLDVGAQAVVGGEAGDAAGDEVPESVKGSAPAVEAAALLSRSRAQLATVGAADCYRLGTLGRDCITCVNTLSACCKCYSVTGC